MLHGLVPLSAAISLSSSLYFSNGVAAECDSDSSDPDSSSLSSGRSVFMPAVSGPYMMGDKGVMLRDWVNREPGPAPEAPSCSS